MSFSNLYFIFIFMPLFFFLYYRSNEKLKKWELLIASILFYSLGDFRHIYIVIISLIINFGFNYYIVAPSVKRRKRQKNILRARRSKIALVSIVILDVLCLLCLKFYPAFCANGTLLLGYELTPVEFFLQPLGFSFYTFQVISYQVDSYRGAVERKAGFLDYCLYLCMFPQFIAGPILRYREVEKQLCKPDVSLETLEKGCKWFVFGLALKVLLADPLFTLWNSIEAIGVSDLIPLTAWLGAVTLSMQIYMDFWGYSVMAIGLGQMLGYHIPVNFDHPYTAKTVSAFYRKWHITLGTWFRDYIYIPLGGSRGGKLRTIINLFVVWMLTGLWHGVTWNFLLWGGLLFLFIAVEKLGVGKWLERTRVVGHLYILLLIPITWIAFSYTNIQDVGHYILRMFWCNGESMSRGMRQFGRFILQYKFILAAAFVGCTPLPYRFVEKRINKWYINILLLCLFWLAVYELYLGRNNPFLYFKF